MESFADTRSDIGVQLFQLLKTSFKIPVEIQRKKEYNSQKMVLATEIRRLDKKVDRIDERIDTAMQIRERLATVEVKLVAMER